MLSKSPLAFKQSLEQRLLNEAKEQNVDVQRLRQFAIYERFLARIFAIFEEEAILKGGIALALRNPEARTTKDVDLSLRGNPNTTAAKLSQVGMLELSDYFTFTLKIDSRHPEIVAEGLPYPGKRFRAEAFLAGKIYGSGFGVDIVFSEPTLRTADLWQKKSVFEFAQIEGPVIRICPVEVHLAEKLHAYTQPRAHLNSRVKDLPDIALLAMLGNLSASNLRLCLQQCFNQRHSHQLPREMPLPPEEWEPKYASMAKSERLPWDSLEKSMPRQAPSLTPCWLAMKVSGTPKIGVGNEVSLPVQAFRTGSLRRSAR